MKVLFALLMSALLLNGCGASESSSNTSSDDGWLIGGTVTPNGDGFLVTDRKWNELLSNYGDYLSEEMVQGKTVLDIATGGGAFIRALRQRGANAWGIDYDDKAAALNKDYPYFVQGDAYDLVGSLSAVKGVPLKYDLLFSSWALPSYPSSGNDRQKMSTFFRSVKSVMKRGAVFAFTPVLHSARSNIESVLAEIPGLRVLDIKKAEIPSPHGASVRMQVIYQYPDCVEEFAMITKTEFNGTCVNQTSGRERCYAVNDGRIKYTEDLSAEQACKEAG